MNSYAKVGPVFGEMAKCNDWSTEKQHKTQQVCVQLSTYADNVALPAFARRCCLAPAVQQSTNISCSPRPQQQTCNSGFTAVGPCCMGQTEWWTDERSDGHKDGRTPYCYIDPAPHPVRAVPKTERRPCHGPLRHAQNIKIRSRKWCKITAVQ